MPDTLLLARSQVAQLLDLRTCIAAVEQALRLYGAGVAPPPATTAIHVANGGFHTKTGALPLDRFYFAAKTNANFMDNRARTGLPTIQGTIVLHDAEDGRPLAVMDAIEITALRTGAATAVAAKYLARPDSAAVAVAGCGAQGRVQLRAAAAVLPLQRAFVWDIDPERAERLAADLAAELGIEIAPAGDWSRAAQQADVVITCTPSRHYLLGPDDVRPGAFVAGVGADNPHKRELDPRLLATGTLVVDILEQCATMGDLHHAIAEGLVTRQDVHAELGAIVAGRVPGRTGADEITVYDSTGMALQDVAAAAAVYGRARDAGVGRVIDFGA